MTQERTVSTKALSAYLASRHTSLSATIFKLGLSQELLDNPTIGEELLGRIARMFSLNAEQLAALTTAHASA